MIILMFFSGAVVGTCFGFVLASVVWSGRDLMFENNLGYSPEKHKKQLKIAAAGYAKVFSWRYLWLIVLAKLGFGGNVDG